VISTCQGDLVTIFVRLRDSAYLLVYAPTSGATTSAPSLQTPSSAHTLKMHSINTLLVALGVSLGRASIPCSGAGTIVDQKCVCEPGFNGTTCSLLNTAYPIPLSSGFDMKSSGYHVWGSQVQYYDGKYHMIASIYDGDVSFYQNWLTNGQVRIRTHA